LVFPFNRCTSHAAMKPAVLRRTLSFLNQHHS
jgi:hypothetical protein